ncbi:MAG TPA: SAM-dependent methyltransferase [Gammaproteobacteria bacterium]|nr:SAM-dependent methyltransferase [Gammaproteobacteria bacterium]
MSRANLPVPSDEASQQSAALIAKIRDEIERAGGWIDFAHYMQLALYAPGLGYYSAGSLKIGAAGDFVTAPELSRSFGRAIALTLDAELTALGSNDVIELGAGSGALAAQLLDTFALLGREVRYWILEPSADLRQRQQRALEAFAGKVVWLDRLPESLLEAAVVANEVLDALPVSRFIVDDGEPKALGVVADVDGLRWGPARENAELTAAVRALEHALQRPLPNGFSSEVCLTLPAWFATLAAMLKRGSLLFADYGLVRSDYYHEQRSAGTLVCHYRHRAHDDPFAYPGLQDITAWVDFSACADAATEAGFDVAGFTTQGQYLLSVLAALPPELAGDLKSPREQSAMKTLILPGEMGERFKVLLLRKGVSGPELPGKDFRYRL